LVFQDVCIIVTVDVVDRLERTDAPAASRVFGFPKIPSRVFAEYRSLSTSRETSQNRRPLDFLVDVNSLKSIPAPRQLNDVSVNLYQTQELKGVDELTIVPVFPL
jgi:hypothetical protein